MQVYEYFNVYFLSLYLNWILSIQLVCSIIVSCYNHFILSKLYINTAKSLYYNQKSGNPAQNQVCKAESLKQISVCFEEHRDLLFLFIKN